MCGSPRLIAACHVLRRLFAPRHPPYALSSLTIKLTQETNLKKTEVRRQKSEDRRKPPNLIHRPPPLKARNWAALHDPMTIRSDFAFAVWNHSLAVAARQLHPAKTKPNFAGSGDTCYYMCCPSIFNCQRSFRFCNPEVRSQQSELVFF